MKYVSAYALLFLALVGLTNAITKGYEMPMEVQKGCNIVASNEEFIHSTTQVINEEYDAFLSEDEVAEIVFIRCMGRMLNEKAEQQLENYLSQNRQRS